MTREQLDTIECEITFGLSANQTKWARSKARMAAARLTALAREALELREALEWFVNQSDAELSKFEGVYKVQCYEWLGPCHNVFLKGEGATLLLAIQNMRKPKP